MIGLPYRIGRGLASVVALAVLFGALPIGLVARRPLEVRRGQSTRRDRPTVAVGHSRNWATPRRSRSETTSS